MKRSISWISLGSLLAFASFLNIGLVSAQDSDIYLPDYLVFRDDGTNETVDYTDFNNYSDYGTFPVGGHLDTSDDERGDQLYIGAVVPFDGIQLEIRQSLSDGEYVLSYFSNEEGWVDIDGGTYTKLNGDIELTWDSSTFDWDPGEIYYDYSATDPDDNESGTYAGYFLKLETTEASNEDDYALADALYVTFAEDETVEEDTTPAEVTTVSTPTFSDVESYHDNFAAIEYLVHIGTLQGYSDNTFRPDATVNRAELMKMVVAGQEIDPNPDTYKNCFPDVTTEWFAKYVCYAKEMGWVDGYPDTTFKPGNAVNKVEAIKIVINSLGFKDLVPESVFGSLFSDVDDDQWYSPFIYVAKEMNMLEEKYFWNTSAMYYPGNEMTRGEVAENIFRGWVVNQLDVSSYTMADRYAFFADVGFEVVETDAPVTDSGSTDDGSTDDTVYLNLTSSSSDGSLTIENLGDSTVNLSGYTLETSSKFYTFGSYNLAPGETVELDYYYPGETVYLRNSGGGIVESDYNS